MSKPTLATLCIISKFPSMTRFLLTLISMLMSAWLCSCVWEETISNPDYLPLDDSLFPYAKLPRFIIETKDFKQINNKTTYHPGRLQIFGENAPVSDIVSVSIKGRGYSSFETPKFSYKIEFGEKLGFLDMPENQDWDLVSNFKDKSFLRNAITYQLANTLNAPYAPRFRFVELYVNREYKGVYFLTEHVKVGKNRVNIPKDGSAYLVEKTILKDSVIHFTTQGGNEFKVKYPKNPSDSILEVAKNHFDDFEEFLSGKGFEDLPLDTLEKWIDVKDIIRYYWIQEFSKNIDGTFRRSIFITWQVGGIIQMGPVWDFDTSYGIGNDKMVSPNDLYIRKEGWFKALFQNKAFKQEANEYWKRNRDTFLAVNDSIPVLKQQIAQAIKNDEKRWPILENNKDWPLVDSYPDYDTAVDSLKNWISQRVQWISNHL